MDILEVMQYPWAARALIAASLVGILCGTLGVFIVLRNMALIGDALAHAILPGIVVAFILAGYSTLAFFIGAVAAGLLTAVAITWIQHSSNTKNDAAIGIAFTAMFALGVIGISRISRNQGVHLDLKDFLFGNILGVSDQDLYLTGAVTLFSLAAILLFYRPLFATTFQATIARTMGVSVRSIHYFLMLLLSFAVVAALRTVGVILVVAMLITPAATALLLARRLPAVLLLSALIGLATAVTGFFIAIWLETTPGPAMTVCATLFYLTALVWAPEKGLIPSALRKRALRRKIIQEDILKKAMKAQGQTDSWLEGITQGTGQMRRYIQLLVRKGWLRLENGQYELTPEGRDRANDIIRAHRLWETYLVEMAGMKQEEIHEDAEQKEHLLPEELLEEIDALLGFPEQDPHGSPIPPKAGNQHIPLWELTEGETCYLSAASVAALERTSSKPLNLDPSIPVRIVQKSDTEITLSQENEILKLHADDALNIRARKIHSSSGEPI